MKLKRNHYFISFLRVCRHHKKTRKLFFRGKARNLLFHIITPNFNIYRITFIILITLFTFFINLLVGFIIDFLIIYFLPHTIPHEFVTFVTTSLTGMFCLSRVINKLQRFKAKWVIILINYWGRFPFITYLTYLTFYRIFWIHYFIYLAHIIWLYHLAIVGLTTS